MLTRFDIPFGDRLPFDFFRPDTDEVVPLLVFIHGGGWISGDKTHFTQEAQQQTNDGYACACISYRLAPLHPFPAAILDVQEFIVAIRARAHEFMIDPTRIAAIGSSAGGHLATMVGLLDKMMDGSESSHSPQVNAVVDFCGLTDLTRPREQHFPIAHEFLEAFAGVPYTESPETWEKASPLTHVSATAAPFLIFHGDEDDVVPLDQSQRLHEALNICGVSTRLVIMPGEGHGFGAESYAKAWELTREFLRTSIRAKDASAMA